MIIRANTNCARLMVTSMSGRGNDYYVKCSLDTFEIGLGNRNLERIKEYHPNKNIYYTEGYGSMIYCVASDENDLENKLRRMIG